MMYRLLADGVVVIHLSFVLFVLAGGVLVVRWPWLKWVHLPCVAWGAGIEIGGWICPLTRLENHLRIQGLAAGYPDSFVEHYLWPLIYPEMWFPGGFPAWGFVAIGCGVLVINGFFYARVFQRRAS
ncbi:MAG: DUF2784 domain-containing protein [Magnetococcales bacterium]|nr:DUF2784 domain-containing protein [Magnetococcales bacterium]